MIKEKTKIPFLCMDVIFKSIFIEYPNILSKMISDITGIKYSLLKDNIELVTNEIPIKRKNEKFKKCDFIVKIDSDNIINLEINTNNHKSSKIKNLSYSFDIFSSNSSKGEKYNPNFKFIQINLNCYKDSSKNALVEIGLISNDNNHINYLDNFKILMLNIYKSHEMYYNETNSISIPKYVRWGEFLYNEDISKIPEIMKGVLTHDECNRIIRKMEDLMTNDEYKSLAKKWIEWEEKATMNEMINEARKKGLKEGIEQGIEKGIEQGIEQSNYNTAIKMLKENISIDIISKVTGFSIDNINKLKDTIKV